VQLQDYFRILIKRGWVLVLALIIGAGLGFGISKVQAPEFRSTIFLNVWPGRLDWGLQQTVKGLMRNYAGIIRSRDMAVRVSQELELDLTPDDIAANMTVSPIESDFLIRIDVDNEDPGIARDIAQTSAELFVEDISAYMLNQDKTDRVEISIRDYALPGTLHKPKLKINVLAGAIFGAILGLLVVFLLEWLQADVIRSSDDLEDQAEIAVLGVIPAEATPSRSVKGRLARARQ